jgi:hypothetical protein
VIGVEHRYVAWYIHPDAPANSSSSTDMLSRYGKSINWENLVATETKDNELRKFFDAGLHSTFL